MRLYNRGSLPDSPDAWLISVAMNLFRNVRSTRARRRRLISLVRGRKSHGDPAPAPGKDVEAGEIRDAVRAALDRLPERDRSLLLLRAEGYSYRDLAAALDLGETSVGSLLSRARRAFRESYREGNDGP